MCSVESNEKINLYVLRYNYSGHYYVGTAEDFNKRMLVHWKRTSKSKKRLPNWSRINQSKKGFLFYWFKIEGDGVSRSYADLCENHLARLIAEKVKFINEKKFINEVHIGNNKFIDGQDGKIRIKIDNVKKELNDIDKEVYKYLKNLQTLCPPKINKQLSIKCFRIGCIGEYHQNDSWDKSAILIKFSRDDKEN